MIGYNVGVGSADNYSGYVNVISLNKVTVAENAIDNYFAVLLSGGDPIAALNAMNTAIRAVTVPADQRTVANYYNQQRVVYLYKYALKMISFYSATPNSATLSSAVTAIIQLRPYNNVRALSGLGLYDDTLNQLMQAVSKNLPNTKDILSITPPLNTDGSFGTSVAVDNTGDVFISAPSNAANSSGRIYEFAKNSNNVWMLINEISPISPVAGDHFGRVFCVHGTTLAASSEPANGLARVYVFGLQNNNTWMQYTFLELTTAANVKTINKICLASTLNTIVVGLPQYGSYLIFNHVFDYSMTTPQTFISDRWSLFTESLPPGSTISSVAADGLYIAAGAQIPNGDGTVTGAVFILKGSINVASVNSENEYTMKWDWDIEETGVKGYGQFVGIHQNPGLAIPIGSPILNAITIPAITNVTVAIGSPLENNGAGAVYTAVKSVDPATGQLIWANRNPLHLVLPSLATAAGYELKLSDTGLMVSANSAVIAPSLVSVYHLNSNTNQWSWAYTMENVNRLFGSSLAIKGQTEAIGSPKAANDTNAADISQVQVISSN